MKMLIQGMESELKINGLISFTDIRSEPVKAALHDHFVGNRTESGAAAKNFVAQPNLARAISSLNKVAEVYEQMKSEDLKHIISV